MSAPSSSRPPPSAIRSASWSRTCPTPIAAGSVRAALAYDLVYNPEVTTFLKDARAQGARTIGGLEMLVQQAARQCEWWTGARVDLDVFRMRAKRDAKTA